jgi:phosphoenolpyruvate synthase/pyruvate phosphate dikinase
LTAALDKRDIIYEQKVKILEHWQMSYSSLGKQRETIEMMQEAEKLIEATDKKVVEAEAFKGIPASPALTTVFPNTRGIVSDHGGMLASAAIVAREYGIPAVVGTSTTTASICDGDIVRVDGTQGRVEVISKTQSRKSDNPATRPLWKSAL